MKVGIGNPLKMSCRRPKNNAEGKIDIMKWANVLVALIGSLLIPVAPIYAQTQAEMNATAREDFARADADLNKTYQAALAKLVDSESKQSSRKSSGHGSRPAMPRQHAPPMRQTAARWLPCSATKR